MRIDSRNLLARLDQPDFDYRDFPTSEGGEDAAYRWPLIEFVHRATVVARRPAPAAQAAWGDYPPQPAAAPQPAYAPPPRAADPSGSRAFFAHYRPSVAPQPAAPEPPAPPPPAAQDLGSLFASYSDGR